VTNHYAVQNAKEIQVSLNDGRTFTGKVIGTDPPTDIALIKVDYGAIQGDLIQTDAAIRPGS
jgi:serine protease Do